MTKDSKSVILPPGTSAAIGDLGNTANIALEIGRSVVRGIANQRVRHEMEEDRRAEADAQARILAAPPPVHGSARWASATDLRARGHLRPAAAFDNPEASDILLGAFPEAGNDWLYWDDEGHLMTVAPTRTGKSTTLIVPNLLRYKGSCVVLDPKGELYRATSKWRSGLGPVYRIAPFEQKTDAFNPLAGIQSASDARALADLMIPEDPHSAHFFRKDAVAFLNGLIQHVFETAPPARMTVAEVRRLTAVPTDRFLQLARDMAASRNIAAANAGNIVLGKAKDRGLPNLRETLNTELSVWDDDGVINATRSAGVDFRTLKDRTATVYITVPFHKMEAFAPFLKVVLAAALDGMLQNPVVPKIPVLFVLDEFLSLGPFPRFRNAIMTHAGAGVRLWFFLQNLAMLEEHYPTTWRLFDDAAVRMFFGTTDPHTAKLISEDAGETTVAHQSSSFTIGKSVSREDFFDTGSGETLNVTHSVALNGRRLIMPDEVVRKLSGTHADGTRDAIIRLKDLPPVVARLVPYFLGQRANQRIGSLP